MLLTCMWGRNTKLCELPMCNQKSNFSLIFWLQPPKSLSDCCDEMYTWVAHVIIDFRLKNITYIVIYNSRECIRGIADYRAKDCEVLLCFINIPLSLTSSTFPTSGARYWCSSTICSCQYSWGLLGLVKQLSSFLSCTINQHQTPILGMQWNNSY